MNSLAMEVFRYVEPVTESGCWIWMRSTSQGYGQIIRAGKHYSTNRIVLEWKLGRPLRRGWFACHHCDVHECCNPAHIFEGTPAHNSQDMATKGRGANGFTRATHCVNGHKFTDENTSYRPKGGRRCRTCDRIKHNTKYSMSEWQAIRVRDSRGRWRSIAQERPDGTE